MKKLPVVSLQPPARWCWCWALTA